MRKSLCLSVVIVILSLALFCLSGFIEAATAPTITPLGSFTLSGGAPARIAVDNTGKYYVTDANTDAVYVFSNNGVELLRISVDEPRSIAVDQSGNIFVGSKSKGNVSAFNSKGELLYKLGSGDGEFGLPSDIAVSSSGTIFVTDSTNSRVKAYTTDGAFSFSISGISFPTGIAVDDAASEVYISDHTSSWIKIYSLTGTYKRYIRGASTWSSVFNAPQGLALDSTRLYVVDPYSSTVVAYSKSGSFLKYIGNYGENTGEFRTPLDIAIDNDSKAFITNHNNGRIEVIGIDSYTKLNVDPSTLSFSIFEDESPAAQTVSLTSSGNEIGWTAAASNSWVTVSPEAGTTPSDVSISVDPAGLSAGSYSAEVTFSTTTGTGTVVMVNLEVKAPDKTLSVSPTSMSFKYQQESSKLPSGNIAITSTGGELSWTATTATSWIGLDSTAGVTPANIKLSITDAVSTVSPGTYDASVTIDGGSAKNSPATVNVSLKVIYAGTIKVTTNLDEAGFEITGTSSYSGTGKEWSNDEVTPGDYTIAFKHVTGYIKPSTKTFTVETGKEVAIDVQYRTKPVATHIIAGSGGNSGEKKGKSVVVLTVDGTQQIASFEPFESPKSIRVAAGDLDGSGTDKIVVTDHKRRIKVYTSEGTELASLQMAEGYTRSVIAVADIDEDAKAEIIVGVKNGSDDDSDDDTDDANTQREIKLYRYDNGELVESDTLYTENKNKEFRIAIGDIDGDGAVELLMADESGVKAFEIDLTSDSNKLTAIWTISEEYKDIPEISAGDIDDDGIAEIALSMNTETDKNNARAKVKKSKDSGDTNTDTGTDNGKGNDDKDGEGNGGEDKGGGNEGKDTDTDTDTGTDTTTDTDSSTDTSTDNGKGNDTDTEGSGNTDNGKGNDDTDTGEGNTDTTTDTDTDTDTETDTDKKETSQIKILKGTGEDYGLSIDAYGDLGYEKPSTVVLGDTDGDGIDEIAAGAGRDEHNEALIRMYESDGTFTGTTIKAMESKFGVNVGLGSFK